MNNKNILVVGGGLSGITISRLFKDSGDNVQIYEKNKNIGGLLVDHINEEANCYVSNFGPHIFHTDKPEVFNFLKRFTEFNNYTHRVLLVSDNGISYWPISTKDVELFSFMNGQEPIENNFIVPYSKKQWGSDYKEVTKNIKNRMKFKESTTGLFFENEMQGMPIDGYSNMLLEMLPKDVKVKTNKNICIDDINLGYWDNVIVTSPIDEFFKYKFGKLEYKTIDFEFKNINSDSNVLPTSVVNFPKHSTITRVTEYNQFYPDNKRSNIRILSNEKPRKFKNKNDIRIYPVITEKNLNTLDKYKIYAKRFKNIRMLGRLGEYRYLDMDDCVYNATSLFNEIKGGELANE